ncbi:MAG TPA: thioredoxin [Firmicutes bacterium]|nr:thioredoxin [Bacillota bacterium]
MLDTADFEKEVMAEKGLVLVDFYADWCMPCKMLSPILEELSEEIDDVKIVKVNTDKNQELASSFGIMSIPTLLFVKDGKVIDTMVGMRPKEELERVIKSYI